MSEQTELFSPSVGGRGGGLFLEEEDGSGISFPPDDVPDVEKSMTEMSCIASAEICGGRMEIVVRRRIGRSRFARRENEDII